MAAPSSTQNCPDNCGSMPGCAPLAVPYVPFQQTDPKRYERMEALSEGTLFPGLNLPFHLMKNPTDAEAFTLYQSYAALLEQGRKAFLEQIGPLNQTDSAQDSSYTWVCSPWPWQNPQKEG